MAREADQIIRLERDAKDHILPKDFSEVVVHRFFPVMSITYLLSIFVIAIGVGKIYFLKYIFLDSTAYMMGLLVVLWVLGPSFVWVLVRSHPLMSSVAELWYKVLSGLMVLIVILSFFLFPEGHMYGMRIYFAISIPIFVMIYYVLLKDKLPLLASYPLNAAGFCAFVWGMSVDSIF